MSTLQQLDQAIGAHALLKTRLRAAAESGRLEASLGSLAAHAACPFGRWLGGPAIAPATRASAHFATARALHERVHIEAAKVAIMVSRGDRVAARAALARGGDFDLASAAFTAALLEWKQRLTAAPVPRPSGETPMPRPSGAIPGLALA